MRDGNSSERVQTVRALWLAIAVAASAGWFAGPISRWHALQTVCHPDSTCAAWQLGAGATRTLGEHGLSLLSYAVFTVSVLAAVWMIWYGLGALIILRKPDDRGAVLAAFFLAVFPMWGATTWLPTSTLTNVAGSVFIVALLFFGLLFPDGRFAPLWTRRLAIAIVLLMAVSDLPLPSALNAAGLIVFIALFVGVATAQVQRYRSVSSWAQRQQTKWGMLGLVMAILGLVTMWATASVVPFPTGSGSLWYAMTNEAGIALLVTVIPVFIGTSVLRNRLWDIDRIINQALVYALFSALVVGIYIGSVVGLQALFRLIIGSSSTLAIALSTLAIAALFGPLRRHVQAIIDRRFYRRKYDAAQTLASFSTRLRDEVDLVHLDEAIVSVVEETMQPAHVSLWLVDRQQRGRA